MNIRSRPFILRHLTDEALSQLRCDLEHDRAVDVDDDSLADLLDAVENEIAWRFGIDTGSV